MTDIIKLAKEAGAEIDLCLDPEDQTLIDFTEAQLAEYTARIRAEGMEQAAVMCDEIARGYDCVHHPQAEQVADECASAIRCAVPAAAKGPKP